MTLPHFYALIVLIVLGACVFAGLLHLIFDWVPPSDITLTVWRRDAPR